MIDTVKFYFCMTDRMFKRLRCDTALKQKGTVLYGNKFYLPHPFKGKNPAVYFDFDKRQFHMETSLPKLLQGHNVFGSNRLQFLCLQAIALIYQHLDLRYTVAERSQIKEQRIRLGRADTTCSYYLDSPELVAVVLEAICAQLRAENSSWSAHGSADFETVYNQQHSTRVTDKFYNKGRELNVRKLPSNIAARDRILKYAFRLLRYEVTWRAKELKSLGLEYADQWNPDLVRDMLKKRLAKFRFQGMIRDCLEAEQIDDLNDSCHMFYRLWSNGVNLKDYRKNRTLQRARERLLDEHEVDIFHPSMTGSTIPLDSLLKPENAYFTAPKSLTRRGAIFGFPRYQARDAT